MAQPSKVQIPYTSFFYSQGLRFSCKRCSVCCRYEAGFVFLSAADLASLKTAMNLEQEEFIDLYCRWVPFEKGESRLSLKEKSEFDCIFWKNGEGCSIYESRPLQCRAFPFWASVLEDEKNWKIAAEECPGMDNGCLHTPDSIEKWLAIQKNEPILFRRG